MNIGIDVDGVLTDFERYQLRRGKKYFATKNHGTSVNEDQILIRNIFSCSESEERKFWTRYLIPYCLFEPARKEAARTIKTLREKGDRVYIITGRIYTTENSLRGKAFRFLLLNWLKRNRIEYDDIVFCTAPNDCLEKLAACQEFNIDIMIEDRVENILCIGRITRVLCYEAQYNRNLPEIASIERVSSFSQVASAIQAYREQRIPSMIDKKI